GREIVRPHVTQPDHEVHARVLAGDLHAIPEVLAQRADHRAAPQKQVFDPDARPRTVSTSDCSREVTLGCLAAQSILPGSLEAKYFSKHCSGTDRDQRCARYAWRSETVPNAETTARFYRTGRDGD